VNFDAGADRKLNSLHTDDRGGAIALRAKHDPAIAGGDDKRAAGHKNGAGDHTQPIAERAAGRQPQELG